MRYRRTERRRFVRFVFDAKVKFIFLDNVDEDISARLKNLSAEGLCIIAEKEIPINKDIELDISLPGRKEPVRVQSRIIWTHKAKNTSNRSPNSYEAGIKLYTLDKGDENTLLKYYCERVIDNLS